jgi:hypothetical protein
LNARAADRMPGAENAVLSIARSSPIAQPARPCCPFDRLARPDTRRAIDHERTAMASYQYIYVITISS